MSYTKVDLTSLNTLKTNIESKLNNASFYIQKINTLSNSFSTKSTSEYDIQEILLKDNGYYYDGYDADYQRILQKRKNYNAAISELRNNSSAYLESFNSRKDEVIALIQGIIDLINEYDSVAVSPLMQDPDSKTNSTDVGEYAEMIAYDKSNTKLPEDETPIGGGGGSSGGSNTDFKIGDDTPPEESPEDINSEDQTDLENTDPEKQPGDQDENGGEEQSDTDLKDDTDSENSDDKNDGKEQTDTDLKDDENPNDESTGPGGDSDSDSSLKGNNKNENDAPTGADLINISKNLSDDLVSSGDSNTGAEAMDELGWGLAGGAAALMLGLNSTNGEIGAEESMLSNLAMGLDGDRTLGDMGLDVFEHPNHENGGAVQTGVDVGGEDSSIIDEKTNSQFSIQSSEEIEGDSSNGSGSFGALGSAGALAGAAAIGAAVGSGLLAYDNSTGGMLDGGAEINAQGKYVEKKKTLNDVLFGELEESDEEEKKKQKLKENIAMVLTASTGTAFLGMFGLANGGVVEPVWFTISLSLFAVSLLYFNLVKDQKNKRREELSNKSVTAPMNNKKSYFNNEKTVLTANSKTVNKVDWGLFAMILLSTSSFVLKTYDVIDWLLFIILLILLILIIVAYVILKKKMGEQDEQRPMKK